MPTNNDSFPPVQFTIKNFDLTDSISNLIQEKFTHRLERYTKKITHIHLVLEVDSKRHHIAKATLSLVGKSIHADAESPDLYASMDLLIDKLLPQLRKYHDKHSKHHPHHRQDH